MPNFEVGTINAEEPSHAGVGTTSEIIVPETIQRVGLTITNLSAGTIYLGINSTSTLSAGLVLSGGGAAWSMDEYTFSNQAITAIAHTSTLLVAIQQFIR